MHFVALTQVTQQISLSFHRPPYPFEIILSVFCQQHVFTLLEHPLTPNALLSPGYRHGPGCSACKSTKKEDRAGK